MTEPVAVERLKKDLINAATKMTDDEARYLVDYYYIMQDDRKRFNNQERAMGEEPNAVLGWVARQAEVMEGQVKRALDKYTDAHPVGAWLKSLYGIGPVIAAGLLAHIDINKAPTAGHIWSFAGLDPRTTWNKGEKRPWNAKLKTLCWKAGQSFMKFSNQDDCYYGKLYRERKEYELKRNESGENKELAATLIGKYAKTTEAYQHLLGGKLPPAQIDARARRYAVKIFLSHLHHVWYETEFKRPPPRPFAIEHLGHAHMIEVPK